MPLRSLVQSNQFSIKNLTFSSQSKGCWGFRVSTWGRPEPRLTHTISFVTTELNILGYEGNKWFFQALICILGKTLVMVEVESILR